MVVSDSVQTVSVTTYGSVLEFWCGRADDVAARSAMRTVGALPSRIREIPAVSEGEVLREGMSKHGMERRPSVLV